MRTFLLTAGTLLALVILNHPMNAFAQTAKASKVKAETITTAATKVAAAPKAETISTSTLQPAKVIGSSKVTTAATVNKPAATTISKGGLVPAKREKASKVKSDTLKRKEGVRVMTHDEIEKMMTEKALVMKAMLNKPAPEFTATDLNGKSYKMDELKGKTVVLNFWFIGCKPCVMEMPHLNKLVAKYGSEDVVFIAFALDSEVALKKFLVKNPFNYNIIPDAGKIAQDNFKVNSFPTSIIIDKQGLVQDYLIGYSEDVNVQLMAFIDKSLKVK